MKLHWEKINDWTWRAQHGMTLYTAKRIDRTDGCVWKAIVEPLNVVRRWPSTLGEYKGHVNAMKRCVKHFRDGQTEN